MDKVSLSDRWTSIILAAGAGSRMKSRLPKTLHPVAGRPMLVRVIEACQKAGIADVRVVVPPQKSLFEVVLTAMGVNLFVQPEPKGTGHAVQFAGLQDLEGYVLILNGDHPLVEAEHLSQLMNACQQGSLDLVVGSSRLRHPKSYGRIVRDSRGRLMQIVEAVDAPSVNGLGRVEVNTGIYAVRADVLKSLVWELGEHPVKKEIFLTDLVAAAISQGYRVEAIELPKLAAFGVNTQQELAQATRWVFRRQVHRWLAQGVLILDPSTTYIEETVVLEPPCVIHPFVWLRGQTRVGSLSSIESFCYLVDAQIGSQVQVRAFTHVEKSQISDEAVVGPYARIRPQCLIGPKAHVGNFVELKNVRFGSGSKVNHLSYLGDAQVGQGVNVGAGTITCNLNIDGQKYPTIIEDGVFVGSGTQLVAPVTLGARSIVAAGSTITQDVPAGGLGIARSPQVNKPEWADRYRQAQEIRQAQKGSSSSSES